jgi:hypothetical protein
LSLVLRKGKEDIESVNRLLVDHPPISTSVSSPTLNMFDQNQSDSSLTCTNLRTSAIHASTVHLDDRAQMKTIESNSPLTNESTSIDRMRTDSLRSQLSDIDSQHDTYHNRHATVQRTPTDLSDKELHKKKLRKQDENLQNLLDSSDCLDEAALTLNFLTRRLLFKDLLKEKIELKLKEMAVS